MFQVFATTFFERFYAEFAAIFNDFDITISDREVLALRLIWFLIIITLELFRGKSTYATSLLLLLHHLQVIILDLIFFVLFYHEAQVLDLPFDLLTGRTGLNHNWTF